MKSRGLNLRFRLMAGAGTLGVLALLVHLLLGA